MKAFRVIPIIFLAVVLANCKPVQKTAVGFLSNKTWILESLAGSADLSTDFQEEIPYLTFMEAGRLSGGSGCNVFSGIYKLEDASLELDPGAMTQKICTGVKEELFLTTLKGVTKFKKSGDWLVLQNESGDLMKLSPKE